MAVEKRHVLNSTQWKIDSQKHFSMDGYLKYHLVMTFTVRHGKIHHENGKASISMGIMGHGLTMTMSANKNQRVILELILE